ncbi:hypothetical protein GCM10023310_29720 [Paenibacillus vulneris]
MRMTAKSKFITALPILSSVWQLPKSTTLSGCVWKASKGPTKRIYTASVATKRRRITIDYPFERHGRIV